MEKKQYASSYVSSKVADTWEALTEFSNPQVTYQTFKDRLFKIYNQVSLRYILSNLDRIISERQCLGLQSLQDLSDFHLHFNAISSYLITNDLLSTCEQSQLYLRVFDESTQNQITMRWWCWPSAVLLKTNTNDRWEVTNSRVASEVQGQDLHVTNDEVERREGEVKVYKCFSTGRREVREYESRTPIVGVLQERELTTRY